MFNVRLVGDHLYGDCLFTWLSPVVSLMVPYFVLSIVPTRCFGWVPGLH